MFDKQKIIDVLEISGYSPVTSEDIVNIFYKYVTPEVEKHKTETEKICRGLEMQLQNRYQEINRIWEKFETQINKNIIQLEAVKILFDLMKSGITHRQKELFCDQAKTIIDIQIEKINQTKYTILEKDLPF
jgi:hypothetical protein